jgi:hypothetical protein
MNWIVGAQFPAVLITVEQHAPAKEKNSPILNAIVEKLRGLTA